MYRGLIKLTLLCVFVALVGGTACSKDDSQLEELDTARQAVLAEIESAKAALDAKRKELAELRESIASPDEAAADDPEAVTAEELEVEAEALKLEIDGLADELGGKIVTFINDDPPVAGEPLNETLQKAVDIKVDEDIILAREYIRDGGDYRRAISILEQIQPLAQNDERLANELEQAKANRWMTEERFAAVKNGMDEDEVREALGQVNLRNLKEYPDRGVTAWFYPKEDGGGAAVYFRKKGDKLTVYKADFEALKKDEEGEDG